MKNIKRIIPAVVFLAIAFYILVGFQDMLFTAHLRTPFIKGALFWEEINTGPFSAMRWIGCWLTQMAYYPMLATLLYIVIWGISYFFLDRTLRLPEKWTSLTMLPFACMLLGITGVGYWIYIMKDWGFWFSQSAAFMIILGLMWLCHKIASTKTIIPIAILCFLLFPILGWYSMLMALCMIVLEWRKVEWQVLWFILPLLSPGLWHMWSYTGTSNEVMWIAGFPVFNDADHYIMRPSAPFFVMAAIMFGLVVFAAIADYRKSIIENLLSKIESRETKTENRYSMILITVIVSVISFFGVKFFCFDDYCYQAEMRMSRLAMDDDWRSVIKESQKGENMSRTMETLKNIALLNTGQLGERAFKLGNNAIDIYNPDSIQLNSMQVCAPLVYYNYGKLNYSIRWSMEFAVGYGFSPYFLMNMIRSAQATGETRLAKKYLDILHSHMFYKDWYPQPESAMVENLDRAYANVLDADNNDLESYLIKLYSRSYGANNATVIELSLFNSMIYRNPENFWYAFAHYYSLHKDKPLPLHYQEAYLAFMNLWPAELPFDVDISSFVRQSFDNFLRQYSSLQKSGLDRDAIAEEMKKNWHNSFYWFMLFGRSPK